MKNDLTQRLISYEKGELDEPSIIQLFQELVDSGLAWNLQGHYGRRAYQLIESGDIETWNQISPAPAFAAAPNASQTFTQVI
jgi:hypothetical protein